MDTPLYYETLVDGSDPADDVFIDFCNRCGSPFINHRHEPASDCGDHEW